MHKVSAAVAGVVLLAAFFYSVLALTLNPTRAYASSCNCSTAQLNAEQYCQLHFHSFSLVYFYCPVGNPPNYAAFACVNDPLRQNRLEPCS